MFSTDDTIVAIATPAGRGGLGVIRLSGPSSAAIAAAMLDRRKPLEPRHATFCRVRGVDEAIAIFFASPRSYTGEDTVELSAHGSPVVLRTIVDAAVAAGARLAEPGEFTFRAFLHGRLDLVQAEAVADLVDAVTPLQARAAFDQLEGTLTRRIADIDAALFDLVARLEASLDFPDEGYHFIDPAQLARSIHTISANLDALRSEARQGRLIREGAEVVIVGRTNVGKSSVFNRLAGRDRAIVTDTPGTTRDLVTEQVDIEGVPLTLVDTAGFRCGIDAVEREGIDRARRAMEVATLALVILDRSQPLDENDHLALAATARRRRLVVANKCDRPPAWRDWGQPDDPEAVCVSAETGEGLGELRAAMIATLTAGEPLRDAPAISNIRHLERLDVAAAGLARAEAAAADGGAVPEEFVMVDLQQSRQALEEITGRRTTDDMLRHIFERFCIGK